MNGWGLTVFDSLDTMLLMGLREEYERGLSIVKQANFSVSTVCLTFHSSKAKYQLILPSSTFVQLHYFTLWY
jgi:hypothetical protein